MYFLAGPKIEEIKANKIRDDIYQQSRVKSKATAARHTSRKVSTELSFSAANLDQQDVDIKNSKESEIYVLLFIQCFYNIMRIIYHNCVL